MIKPELIDAVFTEHKRQLEKYPQNYPNGTGSPEFSGVCNMVRDIVTARTELREVTWAEVFFEEALEVLAETEAEKLKAELVQVATVALAWASKL